MFGAAMPAELTEQEILLMAKAGENLLAEMKKLYESGKMTKAQKDVYNELTKIYQSV